MQEKEECLVSNAAYEEITYVKPEGTMRFVAGMVDAFPSRQVPTYLLIGIKRGLVQHNYMGMLARSKNKTLIVPIPNNNVIPTLFDRDEFIAAYSEQKIIGSPQWSKHIVEVVEGKRYNVYGMDLFLEEIQVVPTGETGKCHGRLLFSNMKVLEHGEQSLK